MQAKAVGNIYWFQLFLQAQSPNPDWISNFSALVFQGFWCISIEKDVESLSHRQKWAETTPVPLCECMSFEAMCTVRFCCYSTNFCRSHWQSGCSLKLSRLHLSAWFSSLNWSETSLDDVLTVYSDWYSLKWKLPERFFLMLSGLVMAKH